MSRSSAARVANQRDETIRSKDRGGGALFYLLAASFAGLMTFVLWYVPRHM